jgi:hypothetical protein
VISDFDQILKAIELENNSDDRPLIELPKRLSFAPALFLLSAASCVTQSW